jgi:Mce-associated membrane protein
MAEGDDGRGLFLPALLGVLLVALVVAAVVQLRDRSDDPAAALQPTDERAVGAVTVARSAVEAFYGLDYRTVDADLDEVRALATGEFADRYDATADELRQRVRQRRLVTTATLVPDGTATASLTAGRAEVLVAVDVVRRAAGEPDERRGYRARVELVRTDGEWRVSALDAAG